MSTLKHGQEGTNLVKVLGYVLDNFMSHNDFPCLFKLLFACRRVACLSCCEDVVRFLDGIEFSIDTCKELGCDGHPADVNGLDVECDGALLSTSAQDTRNGCEIGRDFAFLGMTVLPSSSVSALSCASTGEISLISLPNPPVNLEDVSENEIQNCLLCCGNMNSKFDETDDFRRRNCEVSLLLAIVCLNIMSRTLVPLVCSVLRNMITATG